MKKAIISFKNKTKEVVNISTKETLRRIAIQNELNDKTKEEQYKNYKNKYLTKFRALQTDILMGLEEPLTNEETEWYSTIKNFNASSEGLPEVPTRIESMDD